MTQNLPPMEVVFNQIIREINQKFCDPIAFCATRIDDMAFEEKLIEAARELAAQADQIRFGAPVTHVYNPLIYAWNAHETYLRRFGGSHKEVIFLGMNPGPFGMAQTGVPFGEIAAVRDWMKIQAAIGRPDREHPRRPVLGFECLRSEISGRRLWGLFEQRFGAAENFFARHFVVNYCPLAFLLEGGRNCTPDKLPAEERDRLSRVCDAHLRRVIEILRPKWLIGVGDFAARRAESVSAGMPIQIGQILHPSPASPAANRDWPGQAASQLRALGVWK
jgi:single-strand selective monofunctional uracil DNA glycosylase